MFSSSLPVIRAIWVLPEATLCSMLSLMGNDHRHELQGLARGRASPRGHLRYKNHQVRGLPRGQGHITTSQASRDIPSSSRLLARPDRRTNTTKHKYTVPVNMILRLLTLLSLLLPSTLADVSTRPFLGNWGVKNLGLDCYDPDRRCQLDFDFTQDTASDSISSTSVWYYPKEQNWGHVVSDRYYLQAAWTRIPSNNIPGNNLSSLLVLVMFDSKLDAFATFNVYEKMLLDFGSNAADQYQAAHYLNPDDGPSAGTTPTAADPTAVEVVGSAATVAMGAMRMDKQRAGVNPRAAQITTGPAGFTPKALVHRDEGNSPIWQILQLHRRKPPPSTTTPPSPPYSYSPLNPQKQYTNPTKKQCTSPSPSTASPARSPSAPCASPTRTARAAGSARGVTRFPSRGGITGIMTGRS